MHWKCWRESSDHSDQIAAYPDGIVWSSKGTTGGGSGGIDSTDATYDIIPLIGDSTTGTSPTYAAAESTYNSTYSTPSGQPFPSSSSFASCAGATDGACNSANILALYNTYTTNSNSGTVTSGATLTDSYAAGFCYGTFNNHSDWYLPAICEMGYTGGGSDAGCGANTNSPTLQNIESSLIDIAGLSAPAGGYWSSTEESGNPQYVRGSSTICFGWRQPSERQW